MNLVTIAEHTVDVDRLTPGGWVLDAGCRNFGFSRGLVERGCRVLTLDPDPTVEDPKERGITHLPFALGAVGGKRDLIMSADPQARYLAPAGAHVQAEQVQVDAFTIAEFMGMFEIGRFDVIKLDVEGSEYDILRAFPGPVATQISIEFHEHVLGRQNDSVYSAIFDRLAGFGYEIARHERDARYCAGENFWDTLVVLK